jgi:hypothetical protein
MSQDIPTSADDFDEWVVNGPLDPTSALFREGNVLLGEQPELANTNLYHSVLSAVAQGATRRNEIATVLGADPAPHRDRADRHLLDLVGAPLPRPAQHQRNERAAIDGIGKQRGEFGHRHGLRPIVRAVGEDFNIDLFVV